MTLPALLLLFQYNTSYDFCIAPLQVTDFYNTVLGCDMTFLPSLPAHLLLFQGDDDDNGGDGMPQRRRGHQKQWRGGSGGGADGGFGGGIDSHEQWRRQQKGQRWRRQEW